MRIANYTDLRKNLKNYLDAVVNDSDPLIVPRPGGKGIVVMSLDDYNAIRETEYLMSSPETMRGIREAQAELAAGGGTLVSSKEELEHFLDSL